MLLVENYFYPYLRLNMLESKVIGFQELLSIMLDNLKNIKTVFISGASSGIGEATAIAFAKAGIPEIVLSARRVNRIQELANNLETNYKTKTLCLALDITKPKEIDTEINTLPKEFANIDVLVNNSGLAAGLDPVTTADIADWEAMIDTNLKGLILLTKAILPGMLERANGHIINISSLAGYLAYDKGSVYCATKSAVRAFGKALQKECLNTGVRVSDVAPGKVETEFSLVRFKGNKQLADNVYKDMQPLIAKDIADTILFIASRNKHVNIPQMLVMPAQQTEQLS